MSVNKVILVGRLGQDPESRTSAAGNPVCNLNFATSERVKDGEQWVERTEWHRVVCFGKTADNVQRYCQKGKHLYIEGRIQTRKWQDKEGRDRWSTEIVARDVKFLGGKSEGGGYASPEGYSGSNASTSSDDVPF